MNKLLVTISFLLVAAVLHAQGVNIGPGSNFVMSGAVTVKVGGNWTNDGTFAPGTGTVVLYGSSGSQSIGGASANTFHSLTIDNSSGAVLSCSPVISGALTLTSGKLSIGSNTLTLDGTVAGMSGSNSLTGGASSNLVIGATGPLGTLYFDQATAGTTNNIVDMTMSGAGGTASLGNALNVSGTYTPTAGTLTSGGYLTLVSNSSGTANVAVGSSSGGYISGNVTVERYIPANSNRAWRLLAANTTGQTIQSAWQEGAAAMANPHPGFGTIITCSSAYGTSDGFDEVSSAPSILAFDVPSQSWTTDPVTNTNATDLNSNNGYFLYVRGDRTCTPSNTTITPTVLRSTGGLLTGDQSAISVPATDYVVIGNPYPSDIDFSAIASGDRNNVNDRFWLWDPKLTGSYGLGAYVLFDASTATPWSPSATGGSYSAANSVIPSGMAFFVQGNATGGSLTIRENIKTAGSSNNGFRTTTGTTQQLHIELSVVNTDSSLSEADGVFALYNTEFADTIDTRDAKKLGNTGENFAIRRSGDTLTLQARPAITATDTIFLFSWNMKQLNYRFTLTPTNMAGAGVNGYIVDNYLNTVTPVDLAAPSTYDFSISSVPASAAGDRFFIVMDLGDTLINSSVSNTHAANGDINLYPNPSNDGNVNVEFSNIERGDYQISVYNAAGQKELVKEAPYTGGVATHKLAAGNLVPGTYEVVVEKDNTIFKSFKLTIK